MPSRPRSHGRSSGSAAPRRSPSAGPRLERIAEREHVKVGADAGITEQIPGAADAVAAFEDDEALARALMLQVIARADAGKAGTDDQHVEMVDIRDRHGSPRLPSCAPARSSHRHPRAFGTVGQAETGALHPGNTSRKTGSPAICLLRTAVVTRTIGHVACLAMHLARIEPLEAGIMKHSDLQRRNCAGVSPSPAALSHGLLPSVQPCETTWAAPLMDRAPLTSAAEASQVAVTGDGAADHVAVAPTAPEPVPPTAMAYTVIRIDR